MIFVPKNFPVVVTCATDVAVLFGDKASDSPCQLGTVGLLLQPVEFGRLRVVTFTQMFAFRQGFTGFWQAPIYLFEWFLEDSGTSIFIAAILTSRSREDLNC